MSVNSYPTSYSTKTNNSLAKDLTIFIGLVIDGVLDVRVLESKATELVSLWSILGGTLVTSVSITPRTTVRAEDRFRIAYYKTDKSIFIQDRHSVRFRIAKT